MANNDLVMSSDGLRLTNPSPNTSPQKKDPSSATNKLRSSVHRDCISEFRSQSSDDDLSSSLQLSSSDLQSTPPGSSLRSGVGKKRSGALRRRGSMDSIRSNARSDELTIMSNKQKSRRRFLEATADFTINKLKPIDLVGRDDEIATLRSCFHRLSNQELAPIVRRSFSVVYNEMVFIHGLSGMGKTALASTLKADVAKASTGVFVEGKYEFTANMDVPMSGIAQAFGVLCNNIIKGDQETMTSIKKTINDTMKDEAEALTELIPELRHLVDNEDMGFSSISSTSVVVENRQDQWNHAFRMFTRTVGSYYKEMVLVLDDLQWCDVASLDIIQSLISDVQNPNPVMIIGCYRSNEVDENSILQQRIQTFNDISESFTFRITDIEVEGCDVDEVNTMIMAMMSIDDPQTTQDLARVCFERTMGNPFFLIEFVTMLQSEGLLEFDFSAMKWIWEVAKIEDETMSTENVVAVVQARMRKLPNDVQLLLQYAACLGSSFSPATLEIVWKQNEFRMTDTECNEIPDMLNFVREAKLIESSGTNQLRWVHDKIQEAALSLSDLVTPNFQFRLGLCLYQSLDKMTMEYLLFDVVDLINKDPSKQRPDLAALNLHAALKAQSISAFHSAAKYAAHGIDLLPSDPWGIMHRRLTLQLYALGTEMELAIGHVDAVEEYVSTVLVHEPAVTLDTMPIHMTKIKMLASMKLQFESAIDLGLSLLKDLGVNLAWNRRLVPIQAITSCTRTIKKIKSVPSDHFDNMQRMKDPKQRAIVDLLYRVYYASYNAKNLPLSIVCNCKMIELTLRHGVNEHSGSNLASLAVFVHILQKDHVTTGRFSEMAVALNKRYGSGSRVAETTFTLYGFCMPYIVPFHSCLEPMLNGYIRGVKRGDLEPAYWCLLFHFVSIPFMMGRPLDAILEECEKVGLQFEEANLKGHSLVLNLMWQMVVNLQMAPTVASKQLKGRIFNQESDAGPFAGSIHYAQNTLLLYFGDYEAVANSDIEKRDFHAECAPGNASIPQETFHRGIAAFAMARRTRNRKYKGRATRLRKMVSKFAKAGNPNVRHYDLMLRAEQAALDKSYVKADELYKEAIVLAARTGSLHHAALFNERYADYRLHDHNDVDDAKYLMNEAARFYTDWGAMGKAAELLKEVSFL